MLCFLVLATTCEQHRVIYHEVLSRVVPGVLKEGQQWQVFTAGPAGRANAEGPEVPSTAAGGRSLTPHVSLRVKPCVINKKVSKLAASCY